MTTAARILVVDDTPSNVTLLQKALESEGYRVFTAANGFDAVDTAKREAVDLILMDLMMPERDGVETCRILKRDKNTAGIPVIFVTAALESEQVLNAFGAGGSDYITKPFRLEEVLARVSVHVRLRLAEQELRDRNKDMAELANELAETNAQLAVLSRTDPLTGILNRRTWEESVVLEHERCLRSDACYSILMIDVDYFKAYNDSQGHQLGDNCLRKIAETLCVACRQVDVVGRYGGEEFVVLAPDTQPDCALKVAERIRRSIWALSIPHSKSQISGRITVSIGVASSTSGSWEDVLRRADDALYVAKRAGRNMVYLGRDSAVSSTGPVREPQARNLLGMDDTEPMSRILVVDDEPTNRAVCKGCLTRAGYQVRTANDGVEALKSIEDDPPDVIIMDVMMPRLDGIECTKQLKASPYTRDIPIIIVSALSESDDIMAGLEAGADEYVTKPIRTTELELRVRSMARQYRDRSDLLRSYDIRGEHVRALICLVEFCRAITGSKSLDEVLTHILKAIGELVQSRRISIMMPDATRQALVVRKAVGMEPGAASECTLSLTAPIIGRVFSTGRATVINSDDDAESNFDERESAILNNVPLICAPLGAPGEVVGILTVNDRVGRHPYEAHELEYVELICKVAATSIESNSEREARELASDAIMLALAKLAEHRDNDTGLHLDRVTRYCCLLAGELRKLEEFEDQIDDDFMYNLTRAVPLHDIGKVAIPDRILLHPGKLSPEQMRIMKTHAEIGARTIRALIEKSPSVGFLEMAADIAYYHHEWFNGKGYPMGLSGKAIPLASRITAVADVYDAMTTRRVYKKAFSHEDSKKIVLEGSGTQFDPLVVEAFNAVEPEFERLALEMADEEPADLRRIQLAGTQLESD